MEKNGAVEPGRTPAQDGLQKRAATTDRETQTRELDDDFTKRAADRTAEVLKRGS